MSCMLYLWSGRVLTKLCSEKSGCKLKKIWVESLQALLNLAATRIFLLDSRLKIYLVICTHVINSFERCIG